MTEDARRSTHPLTAWVGAVLLAGVTSLLELASGMTAVVIISLIYRASPKTPWRMSWDGIALIFMYRVSLLLVYALS